MNPHLQLLNTNFNVCATNVSPLYNLMVSMRVFRLDISSSSVAILIPDEVKKTNNNALSLFQSANITLTPSTLGGGGALHESQAPSQHA